MTGTMKAVRIHSFGGPEVLTYEEVPRPEPAADQILVRVQAAGVNPVDWKIRQGLFGESPLPQILGSDFSGVVEAAGSNVRQFKIGDPVFGVVAEESGSYANYAVAPESRAARKPSSLEDTQAAALPTAALTAWQALFDVGDVEPGQKVLVHAASGGVGSFAVQFAHWKGAHVIGTASEANRDYVRELGAEEVIEYRATRFEEVVRDVDMVLDTIGGDTQERSWQVLKPGGILVSIVQPPAKDAGATQRVRGVFMSSKPRGDQLAVIANLVVRGQVKVHVETVVPLEEARRAQELSQTGHTRGKIVLVTGQS